MAQSLLLFGIIRVATTYTDLTHLYVASYNTGSPLWSHSWWARFGPLWRGLSQCRACQQDQRSQIGSRLLRVQWPLKFIHLCFKSSFSSWSHLKWLKSVEVSALMTERHSSSRKGLNSALHMEDRNQFLEWTSGKGVGYKKRNLISLLISMFQTMKHTKTSINKWQIYFFFWYHCPLAGSGIHFLATLIHWRLLMSFLLLI